MKHKFNLLSRMGMTNTPPCLRVNGSSKFLKSLALLFVLMLGVGNVWGEITSPYTGTPSGSVTSSGGNITMSGVEWSYGSADYLAISSSKFQIGSKNNPQTSGWTISTAISKFGSNVTITGITIAAYTGGSGSYDISVGGVSKKSGDLTTTTSSTYSVDKLSVSSGDIDITITGSSKAAYLGTITVTFTTGGGDTRTAVNMTGFTTTNGVTSIVKGNTLSTSVTNDQSGWTAAYTYESDDEDVATVDANGVITGVAKGTAKITASLNVAQDDKDYKAGTTTSKSVDITVTNPTHHYTFSANGTIFSEGNVAEGEAIPFPSTKPADVGGKTFTGWKASPIDGTQQSTPTYVTSATMEKSDVIYYAVFATKTGDETKYKRITNINELVDGLSVVLVSNQYSTVLKHTNNGTNYETAPTEQSSQIEPTEDMVWTLTKSNTKWKLKSGSNTLGSSSLPSSGSSNKSKTISFTTSNSDWTVAASSSGTNNFYFSNGSNSGLEAPSNSANWVVYYNTSIASSSYFALKVYQPNVSYSDYCTSSATTLSFNLNGGTGTTPTSITSFPATFPATTGITKTGYTANGWNSKSDGTGTNKAVGDSYTPASSEIWYVKWTPKTTTVTLSANDATTAGTDQVTATYGQAMPTTSVTMPSRIGYTFNGFYDATSSGTKYYDANGSSAKNWDKEDATKTLYAQWTAKSCNVVFNKNNNDATGSMNNQSITFGQSANLTANAFELTGYSFQGWATTSDGAKAYNDGVEYTMTTEGATLYAVWAPKQSVTITFTDKIHKTSVDSKNVYTGETFEFPTITDKTKEEGSCKGLHYHFMGWVLSGDALIDANIKKANTTSANVTEAAEYLAVWAEGTTTEGTPVTHTLTKDDTSWNSYKSGTQNDDKAYEWSYYASGSNVSGVYWWGIKQDSNNSNITSPTFPKDVTGVSVFVKNGSSKDTRYLYLCSSNSNTAPTSGDLGSVSVNPSNESELSLTLTDKSFKKFYLYSSAALSVKYIKVTYGGSSTTYSNYATECETTYAITKTADDHGTIVAKVADVAVTEAAAGKTVALSVTNLSDNYELTGWTVTKTGDVQTTVSVNNNQFTMPAYPVTVTATITALAKPKYYITYNANGGQFSVEKSAAVEVGQSITIESTIPTKADCTFKGWAWDQDATTPNFVYSNSTFDPSTYTIESAENKTLYAVWDEKQYTVTLVAGSGTSASSYNGSKSNFVLPDATPSTPMSSNGWAFAGWATSQVTDATEIAPAALYNGTTNKYTPTGADNETLYAVYVKGQKDKKYSIADFLASDYSKAPFVIAWEQTSTSPSSYWAMPNAASPYSTTGSKPSGTSITSLSVESPAVTIEKTADGYFDITFVNNNEKKYVAYASSTNIKIQTSSGNASQWKVNDNGYLVNKGTSDRYLVGTGSQLGAYQQPSSYYKLQFLPVTSDYGIYHSTPECCIAPTTSLALQHNGGADEIALVTDGDNYNKTLAISAKENTGNGGPIVLASVTPTEGRSIDGQAITFTKAGTYTITATQAQNGDYCAQEAEMQVTIVNEAVTVSYDANGGEGTIAAQNGKKLEQLTLSDGTGFERAGYGLTGWNTLQTPTDQNPGTAYEKGETINFLPGSMTLYAQWKEVVTYSITKATTFANGDVTISPTSTYAGETVTLTPTPTTGYTLVSISATYMENEQATSLALTKTNDGKYTFTMPAAAVTVNAVFAKAAKYTVSTKTAVTIDETNYTYPDGASATFANTASSNNNQMTSGTTMTLTLSGYEAKQIKGVILNMTSSQSSAGAKGGMTITVGTTQIAAIAEQTEFGSWYNTKSKYNVDKFSSSTFYDVNVALTNNNYIVKEDEKIVIYLKANENSLYCDNFTIFYDDAVIPTHTLTMGAVTGGIINVTDKNNQTVTFTDDEATINEGALIKLEAQAETADNYKFDEWNVSGVTVANNQFKMPAGNVTLNAVFSQYYKYKYDVDGEVSDETEVKKDVEFTLAAAPTKDYYNFAGWKVGETSTVLEAKATTSISANTTFTATWTPKEYKLGVSQVGQGSIVVTVNDVETTPVEGYIQNIPYDAAITATATEASGWVFSNWTALHSSIELTNKAISFNMPGENEQITATFEELLPNKLTLVTSDYYTLTATDKDGNPIADLNSVMAGTKVNVTYNITGNADFKNWSLYDDDLNIFDAYTTQDKTVTFNMPNKALTVEVDLNKYYTVTLESTNGYFSKLRINHGTIIEDVPGSYVVYENDTIKLEATANEHCETPTWYTTRHESEFHCSKNQAYAVVKEDFTIEVRYSAIPQYELKLHAFGQVTNTIQGYRDDVLLEMIGTYTAPTIANYTFVGWSYFEGSKDWIIDNTVTLTENTDLYAVYSTQKQGAAYYYQKVTSNLADWTGDYLIVYKNGDNSVAFDGSRDNGDAGNIDASNNTIAVTIKDSKITGNATIDASSVHFAAGTEAGKYVVTTASGFYIGANTGGSIKTNKSTKIDNGLIPSIDADGNFVYDSNVKNGSDELYFQFNKTSGQERFRFYTGTQEAIQLYKKTQSTYTDYESTPTTTISSEVDASTIFTSGYAGNVVVEDNGKLTIDNALHANSIVIKSTSGSGNGKTADNKATCGQVLINGGSFANVGEAFVELTIDKSADGASAGWYAFSVPFPVDLRTGVYGKSSYNFGDEDWHALTLETHYAIMDYQGDVRAQGKYGWIKTAKHASTLQPGVFYLITVADTDFGTLRFKKTSDGNLISGTGVQTYTYPKSGAGLDTDAGWNGIGNPNIAIAQYVDNGVSTLQFYDHATNSFKGYDKGDINVVVGSAFFIQRDNDKEIEMKINETDSRGYRAPARENEEESQKFAVQLLKGDDMVDQVFVSATETATSTYEIGHDVAKAFMDGEVKCAQLYVEAYATKLCDAEFPLLNNKAEFPLTFTAPQAGEYQLYINRTMTNATLYLYQNGSLVWNLSQGACPIWLDKGTNSEYSLVLEVGKTTPTDINNVGETKLGEPQKFIYDERLILIREGRIYNSAGAQVK